MTAEQTAIATLQQHGPKIVENRFRNLPELRKCLPVTAIQNIKIGSPAVVVASGPSLSKNISELNNEKCVVISCDSAYPVLRKNGINPDYVCSIDYSPETVQKYGGWDTWGTNLVTMPGVATDVLRMPFAQKYYFFNGVTYARLFSKILGTTPPTVQIPIQSCVHLAIMTAQILGCSPIILIGNDYHVNGKSHADGVIKTWEVSQEVNDGLSIHKRTTEIIIKLDSGREWINATQSGRSIAGTRDMKLVDALALQKEKHNLRQAFEDIEKFGENTMTSRTDEINSLVDLVVAVGDLKQAAGMAKGWV